MTSLIGQQVGNYRLVEYLGGGGFADVYKGEHIYLGTYAAIKLLKNQVSQTELQAFTNEARTIARLKHPHIVQVLEFGIENNIPFLVMAYTPEGSLRKKHPRGATLPLSLIVTYVKQIAEALQYAHDQRVVHRDIKPENMLLESVNNVLLSDFGIAVIAHREETLSTQEPIGTMPYMSPEQIRGKAQPASDQYSLGVVVYEWLSGMCPFDGSTSIDIAMQHIMDPPPPFKRDLGTPSQIENVVMKALAKHPHQRFGNIRAFATALEQASQSSRASVSAPLLTQPSVESSSVAPTKLSPVQVDPSTSPGLPPTLPASPNLSMVQPATSNRQSLSSSLNTSVQPTDKVTRFRPATQQQTRTATPGRPKGRISRRTVVLGLAGLGGLAAVGGITWLVLPHQGTTLFTYRGHSDVVNGVDWSPNGQRIASASKDKTVQVWDATSGDHVLTYRGHSDAVNSVAWSPNGKYIATGSADKTVQIWDAASATNILTYREHSGPITSVAWSPDGRHITSGSADGKVLVWNNAPDKTTTILVYDYGSIVWAVAWSNEGGYIVAGGDDGTAQVLDGYVEGRMSAPYHGHSGAVRAVSMTPDASNDINYAYIMSGSTDKTVQVWTFGNGTLFTYRGHSDAVNTVAWSLDGKYIASGSSDKTVRIWNASDSNAFIYKGHSGPVNSVVWSPEGKRIASGSSDKTVQVWQAL